MSTFFYYGKADPKGDQIIGDLLKSKISISLETVSELEKGAVIPCEICPPGGGKRGSRRKASGCTPSLALYRPGAGRA